MNAQVPDGLKPNEAGIAREWLASIDLAYSYRRDKTALIKTQHIGPLRVQRPFYPEQDGTCHTYLLHPPGGMAVGDKLSINAYLEQGTSALITTPSAGKMYGTKGIKNAEAMPQIQQVSLNCDENTVCEWLPQETIIFDAAQAKIATDIYLSPTTKFIGWDIVRLGRAASGEKFNQGYCHQRLQCYRKGRLIFRELNLLDAGSELMNAQWGLQASNTLATMLATVTLNRDQIDEMYTFLPTTNKNAWGLTQKDDIFIARYLGNSILDCREGLRRIWHFLRPLMLAKNACDPRIWNT